MRTYWPCFEVPRLRDSSYSHTLRYDTCIYNILQLPGTYSSIYCCCVALEFQFQFQHASHDLPPVAATAAWLFKTRWGTTEDGNGNTSNAPQHPGPFLRILDKRELVREGERRHLPEGARQYVKQVLQERHVPKRKLWPRHRPGPREMGSFFAGGPRWCNGDRRQRKFVHARPRRHLKWRDKEVEGGQRWRVGKGTCGRGSLAHECPSWHAIVYMLCVSVSCVIQCCKCMCVNESWVTRPYGYFMMSLLRSI